VRHLTEDQRQAEIRRMVDEIKAQAGADKREKGRAPMSVEQILEQDPQSKPTTTVGQGAWAKGTGYEHP
jgi:hypothetical protein